MPRRRCVGCGRIAPKSELVRLAVACDDGARRAQRAVIDAAGVLPGRGAYLCRASSQPDAASADCLAHALRRGGIARTLRRNVKLDLGDPSVETPIRRIDSARVARATAGRRAEPLDLPNT